MGLMWSVLEAELGIINANLPIIRPFIKSILPGLFTASGSRSRATGSDPKRFERLDEGTYPLNPRQQTPLHSSFDPSKPRYNVAITHGSRDEEDVIHGADSVHYRHGSGGKQDSHVTINGLSDPEDGGKLSNEADSDKSIELPGTMMGGGQAITVKKEWKVSQSRTHYQP